MLPPAHGTPMNRRRDIQGLRALAVLLVLIYHFFPGRVPGGFVGVDVFFVISGYLISTVLFKDMDAGKIRFVAFYARRIRRLLPASLVVLACTALAAGMLLGPLQLIRALQDVTWAALSLANVHLAQLTTGYFDVSDPSPVLHFWSLSVEEQYYLVWPLLLSLVLLARGRARQLALAVLIVNFLGSLVLSVRLTNTGSLDAYYSLATRA